MKSLLSNWWSPRDPTLYVLETKCQKVAATWRLEVPEGDVDEDKVHDDGAVGVSGVAEDVHLLEALAVQNRGVDRREGNVVEPRPLLSQQ